MRSGDAPDPGSAADRAVDPDAELVLRQALRVMAGGSRPATTVDAPADRGSRFSAVQLLLLAALIGLIVGVVAGLLVLVL